MADRITVTLHELVGELDLYADDYLRAHHRVTYNLFEFLATLAELAPVDITGLARCLRVSKAAVSKRVPGLVADGWITATPGIGRRIELNLTAQGNQLVDVAGGELEQIFNEMLADPLLDPTQSPGAVEPGALHEHLRVLTSIVIGRGAAS